ncbi:transposase [Porphyromonas sp. COT-290 OH860]|uniref:transposase n=1 Tax=Porphyromonas sp. COT-290 OH860 TaxID=1515615 RepID=UPI0009E09228|nr:transposase [Porphyromonas sp. COT-290 OH860]
MATETKKGKRAKSTSSESLLNDIRRNTKRIFSSEQKVLIVMEGIRGELSVAELCRKYGISDSTYYKWNKEFIEAGKARLEGDILREATSSEVQELRFQNQELKLVLAELVLRYDIVKRDHCTMNPFVASVLSETIAQCAAQSFLYLSRCFLSV